MRELLMALRQEAQKMVVGQEASLEKVIITLISNGHVFLEGVPGLAKTLMIKTLADCIQCGFVRIQFTPDLLLCRYYGDKDL